jgi:hypothetical protein
MRKHAHAIRVHAMRIAGALAGYDKSAFNDHEVHHSRGLISRTAAAPDPTEWPFIDLDPLIGEIDEILVDDGARATWPLDYAACLPFTDDWRDWRVAYARTMSPKEARGHSCRVFSPKMLRMQQVTFEAGRFDHGEANLALLGGRWVDAVRGPISSAKDMMGGRKGCDTVSGMEGNIMAGAALRLRYEWSAIFSFPNGLNLRFGTSAAGALALFRDRDKGLSELRRSPLLHWVGRHWRRGPAPKEAVHEVRTHLRGKEQISWAGMDVTLVPSEYEVEQKLYA